MNDVTDKNNLPKPEAKDTSTLPSVPKKKDDDADIESHCLPEDENDQEVLNHDGREEGDWKSNWPKEAQAKIRNDAIYVGFVFILTFIGILLTWQGALFDVFKGDCSSCLEVKFNQFSYFFFGGMLGGVLFGMKYLYRVVARGYWNEDRRLWRIFSPFIAGGLSVAIGTLFDSGMMGLSVKSSSSTAYFSMGFITGYFADSALAKMSEVADTIFATKHTYIKKD